MGVVGLNIKLTITGRLDLSITDKERVNVLVWLGVAFTVAGAGLLLKVKH